MRIFITGANGFVGRHLIACLLDIYGTSVTVVACVRPGAGIMTRAPDGSGIIGRPAGNIEVASCDITDKDQVTAVIRRARPDAVVHLAARSSGADVDREAISAVNVEGARNVLEAAASLSPFPRSLVVSSGYVYGNTDTARPAREEDAIGPLWRYGPYTDSKIEMESVARNYRGFALIARPFSHTGPRQPANFAVPAFARQLARIERGLDPPLLRVGNLSASRDMMDVRDVVRAYVRLLEDGAAGEVYNIATGAPVEIGDLLDRLRGMSHAETQVEIDTNRLRPAEISCSTGDPFRLWTTTGWKPRIALDTTLADTLEYWRSVVEQ